MIRPLFCISIALFLCPQPSQANDIVDFFRAISGPPPRAHSVDRHHTAQHSSRHQVVGQRAPVAGRRSLTASSVPSRRNASPASHRSHSHSPQRSSRFGGSGISFYVSLGNQAPVVSGPPVGRQIAPLPVPPLPTAPRPGQFSHMPHELGDIVTCNVPIYADVHVERACCIAPNAVPTLVAVRDPNLGRFRSCVEQMVYVEVLAPPCPPRRVRVSPCRTRIRMDYGRYDITIESRDGCVTVKYDD